jgi:hypothetical protein
MTLTFPRLRLTCDVIEHAVSELNLVSIRAGDGFDVRYGGGIATFRITSPNSLLFSGNHTAVFT